MRAKFINESEWYENFSELVDDIFSIWDKWEDDGRAGIYKHLIGDPYNIYGIQFGFPNGWSDDFYVDVNEYLKKYKLENFENIDPFTIEWTDESLIIKPV